MLLNKIKIILGISIFLMFICNVSGIGEITSFATPYNNPCGLAWDGRFLWLVDKTDYYHDGTISKINPTNHFTMDEYLIDEVPDGITWDGNYLWISTTGFWSENKIYKIDPSNGSIIESIESPGGDPGGLAWDGTHLWVADDNTDKFYRINPNNDKIFYAVNYPTEGGNVKDLAWDGTYLWVADDSDNNERIYKIHPSSNHIIEVIELTNCSPIGLTWDGTQFWVASDTYHDEKILPVVYTPKSIVMSTAIDKQNVSISYNKTSEMAPEIDIGSLKVEELSDGTILLKGSILSENGTLSVLFNNKYVGAENWSIPLNEADNNNYKLTINGDDGSTTSANVVITNIINNYNSEKESWISRNFLQLIALLFGSGLILTIYHFFKEKI